MAVLSIVTVPDERLKKKSIEIITVDDEIKKLMGNLLDTMYYYNGVGIAASQVGVLKKVLVIDLQSDDDTERSKGFYPLFIADPQVLEYSRDYVAANEGCLSLPGQVVSVNRPSHIKIRFLDYNNKSIELFTGGWLSRVIQHELDHINGKLLLDHLSFIKQDIMLRKLYKIKKSLK